MIRGWSPAPACQNNEDIPVRLFIALALTAWLLTTPASAQEKAASVSTDSADSADWPQFRGPGGASSAAIGAKLPLPFGPEQNVLWKTEVPKGFSSPCLSGDRIFLTGWEGEKLIAFALDRTSGKTLWRYAVERLGEESYEHRASGPAMPTACTDGERVFFYFGSYGVIATDLDGKPVWEKKMPVPALPFGTGTSPILVDDLLILGRDGCPENAILALDTKSGDTRWSIPRSGFIMSYTTPYVWQNGTRRELVVAGSRMLKSYDLQKGDPLWEVTNTALFVCPSPVGNEQMLFYGAWNTMNAEGRERIESIIPPDFELSDDEAADGERFFDRFDTNDDGKIEKAELPPSRAKDAFQNFDGNRSGALEKTEVLPFMSMGRMPGRNILVAVKAGGSGDVSESHVAWTRQRGIPYVASPLLHDNRLYLIKAGGEISCLDPATGTPHFERVRLPDHGEYYASPIGVDGYVLICSEPGRAFVLKASDELEIVHDVQFDQEILATPAVVGDRLYLRTEGTMWAFGAQSGQ